VNHIESQSKLQRALATDTILYNSHKLKIGLDRFAIPQQLFDLFVAKNSDYLNLVNLEWPRVPTTQEEEEYRSVGGLCATEDELLPLRALVDRLGLGLGREREREGLLQEGINGVEVVDVAAQFALPPGELDLTLMFRTCSHLRVLHLKEAFLPHDSSGIDEMRALVEVDFRDVRGNVNCALAQLVELPYLCSLTLDSRTYPKVYDDNSLKYVAYFVANAIAGPCVGDKQKKIVVEYCPSMFEVEAARIVQAAQEQGQEQGQGQGQGIEGIEGMVPVHVTPDGPIWHLAKWSAEADQVSFAHNGMEDFPIVMEWFAMAKVK